MEGDDINLVELWLRWDPKRWLAGAFAGFLAGLIMILFAITLAIWNGMELWFPIKVAALPLLGATATEYGFHLKSILSGFLTIETLAIFLGILFAHFAATRSFLALLGVGLVWGVFSWIFINNLFIQSFRVIEAVQLSPGVMFPILMIYGISLSSIVLFDRLLRT